MAKKKAAQVTDSSNPEKASPPEPVSESGLTRINPVGYNLRYVTARAKVVLEDHVRGENLDDLRGNFSFSTLEDDPDDEKVYALFASLIAEYYMSVLLRPEDAAKELNTDLLEACLPDIVSLTCSSRGLLLRTLLPEAPPDS